MARSINHEKYNPKSTARDEISATKAQKNFIRSLSKELGVKYKDPVTKARATEVITKLLAAKQNGTKPRMNRPSAVPIKGKKQ